MTPRPALIVLALMLLSCKSTKVETTTSQEYLSALQTHREDYLAEFSESVQSPLSSEETELITFFDGDESWACDCSAQVLSDQPIFQMATYSGSTKPFRRYARAICNGPQRTFDVEIYASLLTQQMPGYEDYLFIPFKDATNGETTYGGGRYIDIVTGDIRGGRVLIDFNKAYNPWCAYSDGYNCPIPPTANHFDFHITAGERSYTKE